MTFLRKFAIFFEIFWRKIYRKKAQSSAETSSLGNTIIQKYLEIFHFWIMVLPNDDVLTFSRNLLLNNGFAQWRRFRGTWGFFFKYDRMQIVELACVSTNINFFRANKGSFTSFCSVLGCLVWCGAAWSNFTRMVKSHLNGVLNANSNISAKKKKSCYFSRYNKYINNFFLSFFFEKHHLGYIYKIF